MSDLMAARWQMGTSLGFHIIFAVLGIGLPLLMVFAEGIYLRTGNLAWLALARRWSKAFAILFAVGAVSGTILSFELWLLFAMFKGKNPAATGAYGASTGELHHTGETENR